MSAKGVDRRSFLKVGAAGLGAFVAGCDQLDQISNNTTDRNILDSASNLSYKVQRLLLRSDDLAPVYPASDITKNFRSNGTHRPSDKAYAAFAKNNFIDWRLTVDGLVDNPLKLSLADLRAMPKRTQITRHDCVEGWSCIGQWGGAPLSVVLAQAKVKPAARYVVFFCADTDADVNNGTDQLDDTSDAATDATPDPNATASPNAPADPDAAADPNAVAGDTDAADDAASDASDDSDDQPIRYYSSIDLVDAMHPQTILAYEMNGETLRVPYGAPLRVRVERQLGYKMPKYIMRISLVDSYADIGGGRGGYWEDQGYEWFAGI